MNMDNSWGERASRPFPLCEQTRGEHRRRGWLSRVLSPALAGLLGLSVGPLADAAPLSFSEEAVARGINFNIGFNFTQFGAGLMMSDLDNDGDLDIVIAAGSTGRFGVYENDGAGNFTDRSFTAGIIYMSVASGLAAADYDNDGDIDIFISGWYTNSRLYRNNGDFTFTDVAASAGIVDPGTPNMGASWGDVNQDGHLDLYVSVRSGHNAFIGSNAMYINNGDGTFTDQAVAMDVDAEEDPTLLSAFFDFDRDGDDDLYLGTDKGSGGVWKNRLYRNDGGVFSEVTSDASADAYIDCMGIAVGDLDFDGYYDLYMTNIQHGNKLLMYNPITGAYNDQTVAAGVGSYEIGWGTFFADFDNDTYLDTYVCNHIYPTPGADGANRLYRGADVADWPLIDEGPVAGVATTERSYCAAEGDIDGDGDIDMLVGTNNGRVLLYINNSPDAAANNWLRFNVVGNRGELNQHAVGTCVELSHDGLQQVRQVRAGTNYKTTSELTLHFGLGDSKSADTVSVIYPGNVIRNLTNAPANRTWTLWPQNRLGDPNGDGVIDRDEIRAAVRARTGPGNPIEPGLEIFDMDGDFDLDNADLALMGLRILSPSVKGHSTGP